jgi:NAD(P)-dependent dehydrogenase (short-subunit alcohol dehydrogenase family)
MNRIFQGELQMTSNSSTALITGGTSGIGLATARKLAQLGIHVVVVGRNAERGKKAVDEIRAAGGQADFIPSDLHDVASVHAVAKKAIELGDGQVDILINNVGIFPFGPTHEMTEEQFEQLPQGLPCEVDVRSGGHRLYTTPGNRGRRPI